MAFSVIYDACVLHPASTRDLLIRLARTGMFQARWTDDILTEMVNSIIRRNPELEQSSLNRTVSLMNAAVSDSLIIGYKPLEAGLTLPDPDDRHILAAAIKSGAQVIVTDNMKDFPSQDLEPWGVEAQTPDTFVLHALELSQAKVIAALQRQADSLKNPPMSVADVLGRLKKNRLEQSVAKIADLLDIIPTVEDDDTAI